MFVDSLLFKFNSDEKQFTQLYISMFAFDCILIPTNGGCPLRAGIGMTINPPGYFMSGLQ